MRTVLEPIKQARDLQAKNAELAARVKLSDEQLQRGYSSRTSA